MKTLFLLLLTATAACSELPNDAQSQPQSPAAQQQSLDVLSRLVVPPGVPYDDAYGGKSVSDKPLLLSHVCNVPTTQRRFLAPGAGPQNAQAIASWPDNQALSTWLKSHTSEDLKWLAVAALVYCTPSDFTYGNAVDTRNGKIEIDEVLWTRLKASN